jgi:hypothetical protein
MLVKYLLSSVDLLWSRRNHQSLDDEKYSNDNHAGGGLRVAKKDDHVSATLTTVLLIRYVACLQVARVFTFSLERGYLSRFCSFVSQQKKKKYALASSIMLPCVDDRHDCYRYLPVHSFLKSECLSRSQYYYSRTDSTYSTVCRQQLWISSLGAATSTVGNNWISILFFRRNACFWGMENKGRYYYCSTVPPRLTRRQKGRRKLALHKGSTSV